MPSALVDPAGTVIEAAPRGWLRRRVTVPAGGGELTVGGATVVAEPLGDSGAHILWRRRAGTAVATAPGLRLELLRTPPRALSGSVETTLTQRHAEVLCLLACSPRGLTADQLALELYGDAGRPVSARAELSRLRRALGDAIRARPYRLADGFDADFLEVERLLARDALDAAVDRYAEPLLPLSEVPVVVEARERLEEELRRRVLAAGDPFLLNRWCQSAAGRDDAPAARALLDLLDEGDPLHAEAAARLRRVAPSPEPEDPPAW